ncbi:Meiotic nuclear division protein 1 [Allomyces arbusculus]|nr:Meiotic nuclear division protein 1 [Allomyces arbusculus]
MAKGVSAEDKRKRVLEIFHESKDVYQLKDIEKLAPKLKGVVAQSVKDVVQALVDDGLVQCEKIGSSNYYWSFPSQAAKAKRMRLDALTAEVEQLQARHDTLVHDLDAARSVREDTDERADLLTRLADEQQREAQLTAELDQYRDSDPESHKLMLQQADVCRDAANRWTDNIFTLQSYCNNKFNLEPAQFRRQFEIPEDFDNLE